MADTDHSPADKPASAADPVAETRAFLARMDQNREFVWKYREYKQKILHFFLYRLGGDRDTAEDLSSALFLRTYERFSSYDDRYAFSTWVYTVARNMLIDHHRKAQHRISAPLSEFADIPDDEQQFFEAFAHVTEAAQVRAAMALLPALQAEAVERRHILLETTAEIAAGMGKSEEAVRQLISRGCRQLREQLEGDASTNA